MDRLDAIVGQGGRAPVRLAVELRLEREGPPVALEPVSVTDLVDARAETWLALDLRRGRPDLPFAQARFTLEPVPDRRGLPHCAGFRLVRPGEGACVFGREALEHVAARATARLRASGALPEGQPAYFTLREARGSAADTPAAPAAPGEPAPPAAGGVRIASDDGAPAGPPLYESRALAPLLAVARRLGPPAVSGELVALWTDEALAAAVRACRRGAVSRPAVETGGLLLGALAHCPESGEVYAFVHDVIEAVHAEATTTSLSFSSRTWAHVEAVLRARRAAPGGAAMIVLGQCHGHNFEPDGRPCEACATAPVCGRSSAFLSGEDLLWCRAVFAGQPWQLGLVAGMTIRHEPDEAFFGLQGGVLARRGVHTLPAAALAEHAPQVAVSAVARVAASDADTAAAIDTATRSDTETRPAPTPTHRGT